MSETQKWLTSLREKSGARTGAVLSYDERDPDAVAESLRIGTELGIPANIVGAEPKPFRRQAEQKRNSSILSNAPATAKWLSDLTNSGLAKDDVGVLAGMETFWAQQGEAWMEMGDRGEESVPGRAVRRGVKRIEASVPGMVAVAEGRKAADVGRSLDSLIAEELENVGGDRASAASRVTALQIAKQRFDNAAGLTEADRADLLRRGGESLARARAILDDAASLEMSEPATRFRDETLAGADKTFWGTLGAFGQDPLGGAAFVAETAAEVLPVLAASTATTALTRSPTAGVGVMAGGSFLMENTTSAMEFLQEKGVDVSTPEAAAAILADENLMREARERGVTRGVVIALFDAVSGGVAGKTLMKSPMGDAVAQGFAQMLFGGAGEGAAQFASGQEINWQEIVIEGLAELVTAPIEVAGVAGRGFLNRAVGAAKSGRTADRLDQVDAQVSQSKLKARSPEKFADFINQTGARDEFLYVPADDLVTYFQAKDTALEDGLTEFGIDPVEFEEMRASGNDVAVPMATYASRISGTEDAAWFRENATLDPDEMSISQAQRFNEEVREVMRDAIDQAERQRTDDLNARASDIQVYDSIFSQLREAGRTRDVADNEARVWAAFFRTMGERYGEDALELARSMGVSIKGPQDEPFRIRSNLDISLNTLRAGRGLKPRGESLVEFVRRKGGVRDTGGDLEAMDAPKGVISETRAKGIERQSQPSMGGMPASASGMGLDEMASAAIEEGYPIDLPDGADEANALLDALREELGGNPIYKPGEGVDADLQGLADELSRRGLDLSALSNDEIAAALQEDAGGRRFDQANPGNWAKGLRRFRSGDLKAGQPISLGKPSDALKASGLPNRDIRFEPAKISRIQEDHPEITDAILEAVGSAIQSPRFVLKSKTRSDSIVVIPVRLTDGRALVVPIQKSKGKGDPNQILSIYMKDDPKWLDGEIKRGAVLYDGEAGGGANPIRSNSGSVQSYSQTDPRTPQDDKIAIDPEFVNLDQIKRGSIQLPSGGLEQGQTVINLFEGNDLSTVMHESGHFFLEAFQTLALKDDAPQSMKDDLAAIYRFLEVEDASQIGTPQHEKLSLIHI